MDDSFEAPLLEPPQYTTLGKLGVVRPTQLVRGVSCRLIEADDLDSVASLLTEGFRKPLRHWTAALAVLKARSVPDAMPRYGYVLESADQVVGVLLVIATLIPGDAAAVVRFNGSSWYVKPGFRAYAPLLLSRALRHLNVTYLNISPAPATWPILQVQGYKRFTDGIFVAVPALKPSWSAARIFDVARLVEAEQAIPEPERELLLDHARAGCIVLWCESKMVGAPLVFRRRAVSSLRLPCAQLVYCRDLGDLTRMAGTVGRFLIRQGMPCANRDQRIDTGSIPGLPGVYVDGKYPMFVRGGAPPRAGDLAYTEAALFGLYALPELTPIGLLPKDRGRPCRIDGLLVGGCESVSSLKSRPRGSRPFGSCCGSIWAGDRYLGAEDRVLYVLAALWFTRMLMPWTASCPARRRAGQPRGVRER